MVKGRRDLWFGVCAFILGNMSGKLLYLVGYFDKLAAGSYYDFTVACLYFLLASFFLVAGGRLLRDWRYTFGNRILPSGKRLLAPIVFLAAEGKPKRFPLVLKAFVAGFSLIFLQLVWGSQDASLGLMVMQAYNPGQEPPIWLLLLVYLAVMESPLIILAAVIGLLTYTEKRCEGLRQNMSKVRIVLSAYFFAYGISFWAAYGPGFLNACRSLIR